MTSSDAPSGAVVLRRGRVRPILAGHPWVFAGSIAEVRGDVGAGDAVWVLAPDERPLGWGVFSPDSALRVRMWGTESSGEHARVDRALDARLRRARARRLRWGLPADGTDAYRLVHAEGDGLPGLCVDVLGDAVVARYGSIALWNRREQVAGVLAELFDGAPVAQLVDAVVAGPEAIYGINHVAGDAGAESLAARFIENGVRYEVDVLRGQKTGHFTDQRENRALVAGLAAERRMLDLCTHTGGFALCAAAAGATEVIGVDSSPAVIERASAHAEANGATASQWIADDAIRFARTQGDGAWDVVVLDPPRLVRNRKHLQGGLKKYRALNAAAIRLVASGGFLATFSCSGLVSREDLARVVADAGRSCGRTVHVLRWLQACDDHPFPAVATESDYLKGLLAVVEP